ncbi:hypothetical protein ACQRIT_007713 [Beauveria bassiana]
MESYLLDPRFLVLDAQLAPWMERKFGSFQVAAAAIAELLATVLSFSINDAPAAAASCDERLADLSAL